MTHRRLGRLLIAIPLVAVALGALSIAPSAMAGETSGAELWARRYNGPRPEDGLARAVAVSPDGSMVFVTGRSAGRLNGDHYVTLAYDATSGARVWARRYRDGEAYSVAISPDGSKVFVTGWSRAPLSQASAYATVAYSASTGTELWVARSAVKSGSGSVAYSVAVSPDGSKVFVTGISNDAAVTDAYLASTGAKLWGRRYRSPSGFSSGLAVKVSPDGSKVFVAGAGSSSKGGIDYQTLAYGAATGHRLWVKRYTDPGNHNDSVQSLALSPDGSAVFITGNSPDANNVEDYATVAYDASSGAQLWVGRYHGPSTFDDWAFSVAANRSTVFVTGSSYPLTGATDPVTVAYDASSGAQLWLDRYHNDGVAYSTAASPDGSKVFITGSSGGDYVTIGYDASTGAQFWLGRYDGPAHQFDGADSIAVSPDGLKVFVAGQSQAGAKKNYAYDWATVAYAP
jgi:PQQ-like domain